MEVYSVGRPLVRVVNMEMIIWNRLPSKSVHKYTFGAHVAGGERGGTQGLKRGFDKMVWDYPGVTLPSVSLYPERYMR